MPARKKYLGLNRDQKKFWHMRGSTIPIVIGVLRTISKGLEREQEKLKIGGWLETIQTTEWLRSARI